MSNYRRPHVFGGTFFITQVTYSGKRLSEIQTKLCLAWFIARDTVPHTTAHRYIRESLGFVVMWLEKRLGKESKRLG